MMYIEGHWENVNTIQDITRVIREYYNEKLADELEAQVEALVDSLRDGYDDLGLMAYDDYSDDYDDDWVD